MTTDSIENTLTAQLALMALMQQPELEPTDVSSDVLARFVQGRSNDEEREAVYHALVSNPQVWELWQEMLLEPQLFCARIDNVVVLRKKSKILEEIEKNPGGIVAVQIITQLAASDGDSLKTNIFLETTEFVCSQVFKDGVPTHIKITCPSDKVEQNAENNNCVYISFGDKKFVFGPFRANGIIKEPIPDGWPEISARLESVEVGLWSSK